MPQITSLFARCYLHDSRLFFLLIITAAAFLYRRHAIYRVCMQDIYRVCVKRDARALLHQHLIEKTAREIVHVRHPIEI